ncbi:hypothetical protein CKAN_01298100 [Cinnamomum micranthum f. kanehirae]|uniref:DUF7615 domain-containing protein n=1 Tax=Cinnamomum micranthum f. kanehirae TaxID=337451 RepID=A0A443P072_9MAGN|nr:hypothetical protein CKAN_01298100 [Cinnamomum micranthum f. kanehirae]
MFKNFFASFTWKIPATATALHLIEEEISNIQNQSDSGSDTLRTYILKRSYEIKEEVGKLDDEIHAMLQSLKMSQESEYMTAKKKFYSHKYICISLCGQLHVERAKVVKQVSTLNNRRDLNTNRANLLKEVDRMNQKFVNLEKKVGQMNQDVVNLENKIDVVLQSLRSLQEYEYGLVQKNLYATKRRLLDLQGELPVKSHTTTPIDDGNLYYLCIVSQMKQEVVKLRDTMNISTQQKVTL